MTLPEEKTTSKGGVPERTYARVRLVLCLLLLLAAVVGGGVWLSSHVDLGSAAFSTVEQSAPEPEDEATEAPADTLADEVAEPEAEPQEEPTADGPAPIEATSDELSEMTVGVLEGYSATEVKPEPEQTQTQDRQPSQSQSPSPSQSQSQQQSGQQPTPTPTPTPEPEPEPEPAQPETLSVTVTVDGSAAGAASWSKSLSLEAGSTVYDALCAADGNVNARSTGYGIYVVGIDGLAEKDHGAKSGWMYAVNGSYPNTACSNYKLKSGDSVTWVYVNVDY